MTQGFDPTVPVFQTPITSLALRTQQNALATHHEGTTAPTNPQLGWIWLDTSNGADRIYKGYNGTAWVSLIGLDSPALIIKLLSQLLDVQITSPTNGQVLTYETASNKWKNQASSGGGTSLVLKQESRNITALNTIQALSSTPSSNSLVQLYINGNLVENGVDFTVSGTTISWISPTFNIDTPDTPALLFYPTTVAGVNLIQETRTVLGVNSITPLSQTPSNAANVKLYLNGQLQQNGVDYTLSGTTINWISPSYNVATTDKVIAWYTY